MIGKLINSLGNKEQSRIFYSLLNAISAITLTIVNGLLGIVVTRMIIGVYGSDFNGINSTANQIVNVLLVVEGGFSLASNVALFAPLTNRDYDKVNRLLSKTRRKFRRIGILFLLLGVVATFLFTLFVNSQLESILVFAVIFMSIIPAAFNLYYATTYRVLLQSQQKEYIINFATMFTISLGYIGNVILIYKGGSVWLIRAITMIASLLNSIIIIQYVRKKNEFLKLDDGKNDEQITGTRDVMAQKITSVLYLSAPIVFLSISPAGGSVLASVYAVYNNVYNMIKSLLRAVIDAPRLGIGQMLSERSRKDVWRVFSEYEYIITNAVFVVITTAFVLIMPFISMYTSGITDANYYDIKIAILMTFIAFFELIHIPSGHLLNMAGEFRVSKIIQVISLCVLSILMVCLGLLFGIYGLLLSVLIVGFLLAVLEIGYIHLFFFEHKLFSYLKFTLPFSIMTIVASWVEYKIFNNIEGVLQFVLYSCMITILNCVVSIVIGVIFNREMTKRVFQRFYSIINSKLKPTLK